MCQNKKNAKKIVFFTYLCYNAHIHILRYSILVGKCCLEGDIKASKGTSMKLLVFALVAQTGVYAGR